MRMISFATLALLTFTKFAVADATTLRIATGDYEPYTGQNIPDEGLVNSRVRTIVETAGFGVDFHYMPWKRTLEATRRGMYDATSYWYYSDARAEDFIHVGPVIEERLVFLVRADSPIRDWSNLEDLSGFRIGVVPGYTYTQELWDLAEAGVLILSEGPTDEANLRKLLAGRVDVVPISDIAGWHLIRRIFADEQQTQLIALGTPLDVTSGYILIPRKLPGAENVATALQNVVDTAQDLVTN